MAKSQIDAKTKKLVDRANQKLDRVKLRVQGGRIYFRGTLPPKPGDGDKPKRYEISTGLNTTPDQIQYALAKAQQLEAAVVMATFDWADVLGERKPRTSIADLVLAFEEDFWQQREKTESRLVNFKRDILRPLKKLPQDKALTEDLLKEVLFTTQVGTRERERFYQAYQRLAKFAGLGIDLSPYRGDYKPNEARKRIWIDDELEELFASIECPKLRSLFAIGAIYGLRNHEVLLADWEQAQETPHAVYVRDGKTGPRWVMPIVEPERNWLQEWQPWEYRNEIAFPDLRKSLEEYAHRYLGDLVTKCVCNSHLRRDRGLTWYQLRYSYNNRCERLGFPEEACARWAGHHRTVHRTHYTARFPFDFQREVYERHMQALRKAHGKNKS